MAVDLKKLAELMKKGWSWEGSSGSGGVPSGVQSVNGVLPDDNGEVAFFHSKSFNFIDGSAIVPGMIQYYGKETMEELCGYYADSATYNVECRRIIMGTDGSIVSRSCIGDEVVKNTNGTTIGHKLFFGDDLCPVILDIAINKIIFDPDWIAPEENVSSVQPDWNQNDPTAADYVKNRPFYRSTERVHANDISPDYSFPCTLTVEPMYDLYAAQAITLEYIAAPGVTYEVFLNGEQYICEGKESVAIGAYVGADPSDDGMTFDFSKYPFVLLRNMLVVPNAGEYTLDVFLYDTKTVRNYGAALKIITMENDDGQQCIGTSDLEKVKAAWNNDFPVYIQSVHDNWGVNLIVTYVDDQRMYAMGATTGSYGKGVESYVQEFSTEDGSLLRSGVTNTGTIYENGNSCPLLYIDNKWYKITIASDGTLKAEVTT